MHPVFPRAFDASPVPGSTGAELLARRGNRRRLVVFVAVFGLAALAGQLWNLTRTDVYRASTLLQVQVPDASQNAALAASSPLADSLPLMTSRPLLVQVARRLADEGIALAGADAATALQAMLRVESTASADVIRVLATGEQPALLFGALKALPDALRETLAGRQQRAADDQLEATRQELAHLEENATRLRGQLDSYRRDASVQAERAEDEAVARVRGLNAALASAAEKEAAAEARLRAMTDAAASGRDRPAPKDNASLNSLEVRASQAREELREMERRFTPQFMALDPRARALRARLTELEEQATQQRSVAHTDALRTAQEELANARAQVERLRHDQAAARPALNNASARFARAKVLEDDLAQVEKARREMLERVARLEADEQRRRPSVAVLEEPLLPAQPYLPDRFGDGWKLLGAALLLALGAMALVEVFNRAPAASPASTTTVVLPTAALADVAALTAGNAAAARLGLAPPAAAVAALPAAERGARAPLNPGEVGALIAAARSPVREAAALALMGLSAGELLALRCGDIDAAAAALHVGGAWARQLTLPAWLGTALAGLAANREPAQPLFASADGQALGEADLQVLVACAAVDAGLADGDRVTPALLRDTCIDWLVDQGLKLSDLPARVGRIDPSSVAALAARAGEAPRPGAGAVSTPMPALRDAPHA